MDHAVDTEPKGYLPEGHFDKSVEPCGRPSRWSEGEGHFAIEIAGTPEGVVGHARRGGAQGQTGDGRHSALRHTCVTKSCRPSHRARCRRSKRSPCVPPEMEPYLREPLSPGWKSVTACPDRSGHPPEIIDKFSLCGALW